MQLSRYALTESIAPSGPLPLDILIDFSTASAIFGAQAEQEPAQWRSSNPSFGITDQDNDLGRAFGYVGRQHQTH